MDDSLQAELSPVSGEEEILRRVHPDFYNPDTQPPVARSAFRPNEMDTTGISVYRQRFTTPEAVARESRNPGMYYVVGFLAGSAFRMRLAIAPDPRPPIPGHCVIPQINYLDSKDPQLKQRVKEWQIELAMEASRSILWMPRRLDSA